MNLKTVAAKVLLMRTLEALPPDAFPERRARIQALLLDDAEDSVELLTELETNFVSDLRRPVSQSTAA